MTNSIKMPTLQWEERLWRDGYLAVAGIDEAGRGALAGPVTAAAVIVPSDARYAGVWSQVCDSKLLSAGRRQELAAEIKDAALAWRVGNTAPAVIDRIGIAAATRQAMAEAAATLPTKPDYLLIDWVQLPTVNISQESFAKADQLSVSVAAASILAKVFRDRQMAELDEVYPCYGFASNKGYGSQAHRDAIVCHGPCPEHRHSFAPIAKRPTLFDGDKASDEAGKKEG